MFIPSCDTLVAMSDVTELGCVIFAKNSDRQTNEPMSIRYVPEKEHRTNSKLKTTFIEIEQVERTNACVFFSPSNIFGAEMGFNCYGLVVGNEAIFTKIQSDQKALTGMDLVRLVLERCQTSFQGKTLLIELIERYGQGGNCGFSSPMFYQNSFILVDSNESWLVEAIGKEYGAKRIRHGFQTFSNRMSFDDPKIFDEISKNFRSRKFYSGFSFSPNDFYNGWLKTYFARARQRQTRSENILKDSNKIRIDDVLKVLRDHHQSESSPYDGLTNVDLCMHAAFVPIRFSQTTGSLISILPTSKSKFSNPVHFATCSSSPCLAIYKPIFLSSNSIFPSFLSDEKFQLLYEAPLTFNSKNLWWKSEVINRNLMKYYGNLSNRINSDRQDLERNIFDHALTIENDQQRNSFSIKSFDQADQLITNWFGLVQDISSRQSSELSYLTELTWKYWQRQAKIPDEFLHYSKTISLEEFLLFSTYSDWLIITLQVSCFLIRRAIFTKKKLSHIARLKFHVDSYK